jgi:thioredoxin-dependent peroxiredoxin
MSKKTRKKSPGATSGKVSRAKPKKTTPKPARTAGSTTAAKGAKKASKKSVKTVTGKATKAPVKAQPKTTLRATPKTALKTSEKSPRTTAAPKSGIAGMKKPANAIAAKPEAIAATKPVAAMSPTAAPGAPPVRDKVATEGGLAPQFRLPRDGGEQVSLGDYLGRKLVIFFYPRADTPGCTKEAMDFTRLRDDFAAAGTAVLGVSADPIKAQESFRNKHQLSTPLLSDETHQMLESYSAWGEKSMYGRTFQGVLRTTVLIDESGRITRIWRSVKVDGHAEAVLDAART